MPHVAVQALRTGSTTDNSGAIHDITDAGSTPLLVEVMNTQGIEAIAADVSWTLDPFAPVPSLAQVALTTSTEE